MAKKAGLIWVDAQSQRVLNVITTNTGVGAIETALEGHSNAGIIECWEGLDEIYSPVPGTGVYSTVRITAVLQFVDGAGSTAKLYLPAPNSNILLSDGDTVDPSAIADVIAASVGQLLSGAGSPVVSFVGGSLIRTRFNGIVTTS